MTMRLANGSGDSWLWRPLMADRRDGHRLRRELEGQVSHRVVPTDLSIAMSPTVRSRFCIDAWPMMAPRFMSMALKYCGTTCQAAEAMGTCAPDTLAAVGGEGVLDLPRSI